MAALKIIRLWVLLVVMLLLSFIIACGIGSSSIDIAAILHPDAVLLNIRLPRIVLAALVGAAMAMAGVAIQTVLRNPLADPHMMGVSGGAAVGGALALACHTAYWAVPTCACLGAFVTMLVMCTWAFSTQRNDPLALLLAGVVINTIAAAIVTLIKTWVTASKAQEILFWLMGSLGLESWATLTVLCLCVVACMSLFLYWANMLDLLALGDMTAMAYGAPVQKVRLYIFATCSILIAAIVSIAGMIGFIGLIVPHVLKRYIGYQHTKLFPAAALVGATCLMLADAISRATFFYLGTEIPVGAITAITGGPFFLWLLYHMR